MASGGFLDARENVALHDLTHQQAINVEQQIQSILDTVRMYLPPSSEPTLSKEYPASSSQAAPEGRESVWVVEDDELVRKTVMSQLSSLGYQVRGFGQGRTALQALQAGADVDLLVADVVMPGGMMGPELVAAAQTQIPGLAVLYASGYTDNSEMHQQLRLTGVPVLEKPFTRETLARTVRTVLDRQPPH